MKRWLLMLYWLSFTLALGVTGMLICCGGGSGTSSTSSPPGGSGTITEQIVVVGQTSSTNFPTSNAAQSSYMGNGDGFVTSGQLTTSSTTTSVFGFSTYLGGSDSEQVRDVFVDDQGNVYVTGWTRSPNLPTTSGPGYHGGQDAFVAKFSASGQLVFLTYLGGSGDEVAYGISVDAAGFIYLNGRTSSPDFPVTQGAFQTIIGGANDVFVTKMKPDGSGLVWSTFVGGSGDDQGRGRNVVDSSGAIYVNGATSSTNFPTQNAFQTSLKGSTDGFVFKLSPDGSRLLYSTYIGGTDTGLDGVVNGLAVNSNGEAFACGFTNAPDFPTTSSAFQRQLKGTNTNATIVRVSADGSHLLASTLLGGSGSSFQSCESLTLDSAGNPVAMGLTGATDFPTTAGVFQTTLQGQLDMWVAKLTPDLSRVVFSTYVGTSGSEVVDTSRIELDASGNIWFALNTDSAAFPVTPNALQAAYGGGTHDAVVVKLAADGSRILYATYLGGSADDFARSFRYRKR